MVVIIDCGNEKEERRKSINKGKKNSKNKNKL
jgi:hypothetical protein